MEYTTMSIASLGESTLLNSKNKPQTHYIRPELPITEFKHHIHQYPTHVTNDVSDIDGARPRTTKERNYVSKSLCVDDIDGARARFRDRFLQTNRHINPLQPEYKMSSAEIAPPEIIPYHRETMMIDDIEGTRTSQRKVFPGRDFNDTQDIDGTKPGWKPLHS
jgi:hypothetical protein